jgi:glycosyltransferase involved in cell wall biosynthesis
MKLLLVNNDKGWGGGQEHLRDLAGELRTLGVDVRFVVRAGSLSQERFAGLGFTVYPMPHHGLDDLKAIMYLASVLRRERFDLISINREHDILLTVLARFLAFPLSRPGKLIMSFHIGVARKQPFLGAMDAVVCVSEHVRTTLLARYPELAQKSHVLHHGITLPEPPAPEKFTRDRIRRQFPGVGFPLIGMVGAFWKNQGELVDCLPALRQAFPGIRIAFVGDNTEWPLVNPLLAKIRALGVEENIIFTGKLPRERIPDVFYDFDLSVTTHRNEGFGIVHLESLAAGTPVVSYTEGGLVDIFRGEDVGVMVEGGAPEFAAAIIDLLRDDRRRFDLGLRGYELVRRSYSLQAMGERYYRFYQQILAS